MNHQSHRPFRASSSIHRLDTSNHHAHRHHSAIAVTPKLIRVQPGSYHAPSNTATSSRRFRSNTSTPVVATLSKFGPGGSATPMLSPPQVHLAEPQPSMLTTPLKPQSSTALSTANIPCFESMNAPGFDESDDENDCSQDFLPADEILTSPPPPHHLTSRHNSSYTPQKTMSSACQSPSSGVSMASPILSQQLSYYSTLQHQSHPSSPCSSPFHPRHHSHLHSHSYNRKTYSEPVPEEHIPPEQQCTKVSQASHSTFSLDKISSILQYAVPGSIFVFDIDDTLIKRAYENSLLLTTKGTNLFETYLQSVQCNSIPQSQQNLLIADLSRYLRCSKLAEPETAQVIAALQEKGCYVVALTARSSNLAALTSQTLRSLGIDLLKSSPPSLPTSAIDQVTRAAVIDGVIYCNDAPKGIVFQQFLTQKWLSFPVLHQCSERSCQSSQQGDVVKVCPSQDQIVTCTAHQNHSGAHRAGTPCPQRYVWFIDDCYQQIQSMNAEWLVAAQKKQMLQSLPSSIAQTIPCQGGLHLVSCHYIHPTNYALNPELNPLKLSEQETERVVAVQISHFIKHATVLSDQKALDILALSPSWGFTGSQTPPSSACSVSSPVENDACDNAIGISCVDSNTVTIPQSNTDNELALRA